MIYKLEHVFYREENRRKNYAQVKDKLGQAVK